MRISISLRKIGKSADDLSAINNEKNYIISSDAYWLSQDVVFCHNIQTHNSFIQEVDRLNGRVAIAGSENITVYVVYVKDAIPCIVGVLTTGLLDKGTIIFELPISQDGSDSSFAKSHGFKITDYNDHDYSDMQLEPDIISATYHNGDQYYANSDRLLSYEKLLKDKYSLLITVNYSEGADI